MTYEDLKLMVGHFWWTIRNIGLSPALKDVYDEVRFRLGGPEPSWWWVRECYVAAVAEKKVTD